MLMTCQLVRLSLFLAAGITLVLIAETAMAEPAADLRKALTFYASFDAEVKGDIGGGVLTAATRHGDPKEPGKYEFREGFDRQVFRIAKDQGIRGGALEAVDVLPNWGRIYFPAKGNLAFASGGWGGAASYWLKIDPNTMLKTPFCDPIQITQRGANNGGIWTDFPDSKPRDFRLGVFPAVPEGGKGIAESDPDAPLATVKEIFFKRDKWHHVVMNWRNLDTGQPNAVVELFIDGKRMGGLENRELAMRWDIEKAGIYVAVNYVGLLDELALFNRPLTEEEIRTLRDRPGEIAPAR